MRIAYIPSFYNIHDYRFLSKLVSTEHEIHLIDYFKTLKIHSNISSYKYNDICNLPYLFIHTYNTNIENKFNGKLFNPLKLLLRVIFLKKVLKKINPQLLHSGWIQDSSLYAALSGFHPCISMPWGSDILIKVKESKLRLYLARFIFNYADIIYCDSWSVRDEIIKINQKCREKTTVFPQLGIDLSKFHPVDQHCKQNIKNRFGLSDNKILLTTRNLEPVYSISTLLESLPSIINEFPKLHTFIIGNGSEMDKLKNMAKMLNITHAITFSGFVDNSVLPVYYQMADVYISTSLSDGTSLSLLEAISSGLPAVVTDIPSILEWVKDGYNGYIVPQKSSQQLSNAILRLLKDPYKIKKMSINNKKISEKNICIEKNFQRLLETYNDLRQ